MAPIVNQEGKKVVYLLGAGASVKALPIVNEMPAAFTAQGVLLRIWEDISAKEHMLNHSLDRYMKYLDQMANWSKQYGTIDTYARSLYIRNELQALDELKLHLTMFFVIEQAIHSYTKLALPISRGYWKEDRIDTRYMGWLALLLERDSTISDRVKILSWNYDLQIDHAIALFKGLKDIGSTYSHDKIRLHPNLQTEPYTAEFADIVRLNGVAGITTFPSGRRQLYSGELDTDHGINKLLVDLFDLYHEYDRRDQATLKCATETLNFAWENNAVAKESVQLAKNAMAHADIVVVIGYSFPSFNRNIDKDLFHSFASERPAERSVVLQNPSLTPETFVQRVGLKLSSEMKVEAEHNMDQFYIPSQLF